MKIAVGTNNPAKVNAVRNVVKKVWPDAEVFGMEVESGVSHTPTSDDEAIRGAKNRAKSCLKKADIGIGIEGFVDDTKHGMFLSGWAVVIDKNGKMGIGARGKYMLPENVATQVRQGKELAPIVDELVGGKDIRQKQGAVGVFTNNFVTRTQAMEFSVIAALTKFISPQYYD